jgi:hypothetical protein
MTNISVCAHGLHCPRQNRRYSDYNFRTDHLISSQTYVLMHFNNSLYPFDIDSNFSFQFLTALPNYSVLSRLYYLAFVG